jgi:quercetin dioxygenase-like cupin family protein
MIIDSFCGKDIQKAFHLTAFFSAISTTLPAGYTFKGESHRFWELVYVAHGRIQATENTDIYPMTEGDLIIHAPTEFHTINNPHDTAADIRICSFFAVGDLPDNLTKGVFRLSVKKRAELEQLLARLHRYFHAEDAAELEGQYCAECISAFLIELADITAEAHPDDSRSAAEYSRVIETMNAHIHDNATLADFA